MGEIEEAWQRVDDGTEALRDHTKRAGTLASKAPVLSRDGSLEALLKTIDSLSGELSATELALDALRAAVVDLQSALSGSNALAREVEAELRALDDGRRVWRTMGEIVAFPVVLSLKSGRVTVDKQTLNSQRPAVIVGATKDALRSGSSPEKFVKALHAAFVLVNGGRETGRVSLIQIHHVLATAPPGGPSYSVSDFRVDLQWLRASRVRTVGGLTLTLEVASAGPTAFPVFDASGDLVNIGYVSFSQIVGEDD